MYSIRVVDAMSNLLFWDLLESKFGCTVPTYIQNILSMNGYDNALSIKTITSEDITFFENFAKSEKMANMIPKDANLADFYGTFTTSTKDFCFLRGHVKLLEEMVKLINSTIASKGAEVFGVKKPKVQPVAKAQIRTDLLGRSLMNNIRFAVLKY